MIDAAPRTIYLLAPGPLGPSLRDAFPGAVELPDAASLRPLSAREAGLVVVERGELGAEVALALAEDAAALDDGWMVALASRGADGPELRPLSVGWPTPPGELALWASSGGGEGNVLETRTVLRRVARARHDINNPLTSGMAETQLLLLDAPDEGETREGLEVIQAQLRRIRDMVADLRALRVPD